MGCNGGRELTYLKWKVARAAPLNPTIPRLSDMPNSITMQNSADNMDVVAQDQTFADCIAEGSHFEGATLTRVTFTRCDLYWASFFMAQLTDVTFDRCDLRGSDFKDATMRDCRFLNCDVGTDAIGGQTEFGDTDLSTVQFVNCRGR
ncbi:Pentapeptide repeats (8 copies) [Crateriforma conspicua]|uniref:Pentapeptide repeats (8 copies) n=1 Tax=Crateriforma conspicua TaxID=2527996 RepID=A0A5C6FIN4_9PLAN|nr:pentapeptide repeat-containing protein [Crateriforma conspicua]TWU59509.1 Pentapeptide repeats (8 copies) [Crateriforma conspicua]